MAKRDLDQFGYCLLENALSPEAATALRTRLVEQAEAEIQRSLDYQDNDGKHMVWFLLNKGQLFRDLLLHPQLELLISHILRPICCPLTMVTFLNRVPLKLFIPISGGCPYRLTEKKRR